MIHCDVVYAAGLGKWDSDSRMTETGIRHRANMAFYHARTPLPDPAGTPHSCPLTALSATTPSPGNPIWDKALRAPQGGCCTNTTGPKPLG
ncbi:putative lipoprotein [Cupriavidus metallidurans CH34]|uniref:Lipoprotein n=1 Tax=Cupriavidus metallidurans (strain ATCC 43123 / DSM 2839 / NBRC 102507 / CH34) TaxID=266264 RepID=D3DXM3_CUPMC|nr:putative lipoprotein [Cupriavidus metallidurans CH34]